MTKQKGFVTLSTPAVLESRLFVHECLVRHFVGHVGHVGQVGLYWCAAGAKKEGAAKHRVLQLPLFFG